MFVAGHSRRISRELFLVGPCLPTRDAPRSALCPSTIPLSTLTRYWTAIARPVLTPLVDTSKMPSQEVKILSDFLLEPAGLRNFMTLRQFTDIFPAAHRSNPAVADLYRELHRLRERDIEHVRVAIADEVKRSKQLRREYAKQRRQQDEATVTGLDPVALQIEEEVCQKLECACIF